MTQSDCTCSAIALDTAIRIVTPCVYPGQVDAPLSRYQSSTGAYGAGCCRVSGLRRGNEAGTGFKSGTSGNPGGRPSLSKALKAAGYDPDELRVEVIQACVNGIRSLDPGSKDEGASWRFCVDKLSIWTGLPQKAPEQPAASTLTDEEYQEELDLIAKERIAKMSPEEKFKLLFNTAPSDNVQ